MSTANPAGLRLTLCYTMNLIIIGASTRAAAFSAHRAGFEPWCVDLFADADLARRFPVRKIAAHDYPHGFLDALRDAPDGAVLYTGGLENYPDLLARIDRPLLGNPPDVLRRVRDPFQLAQALRRHSLPALAVRSEPPPSGDTRRWLLKPLRGSGGIGIRHYDRRPFSAGLHYLQEYVEGSPLGGVFLAIRGSAVYLGATRTLAGGDWLHAPPFHYAGGVFNNGDFDQTVLQPLGTFLVQEFGLAGLFGIDTVVRRGQGTAMLLEVNPRYTASVELIERAFGRPCLELHRAAIDGSTIPWRPECPGIRMTLPGGHMHWDHGSFGGCENPGKAILYARRTLRFPEHGPWEQAFAQPVAAVDYADIPHAGTVIAKGRPVLTVFASAYEGRPDVTNWWCCEQELQPRVETLDRYLFG
jgi:uncharacterized protein